MTTDYAASQRAIETRSEAILSAKNATRGIFTADPNTDSNARLYKTINYDTIITERLTVVDHPSVILARDHNIPIHLFDFAEASAIIRICSGENPGTMVADVDDQLEP